MLAADLFSAQRNALANGGPNTAGRPQIEMSIAINPANPDIVAGISFNLATNPLDNDTHALMISTDGNTSEDNWTTIVIGGTQPGDIDDSADVDVGAASNRGDPVITFDDEGYLYLAYLAFVDQSTLETIVARSSTPVNSATAVANLPSRTTDPYLDFAVLDIDPAPTSDGTGATDKIQLVVGRDPTHSNQQNIYVSYNELFMGVFDRGVHVAAACRNCDPSNADHEFAENAQGETDTVWQDWFLAPTFDNFFSDVGVGPNGELYTVWQRHTDPSPDQSVDIRMTYTPTTVFAASDPFQAVQTVGEGIGGEDDKLYLGVPAQPTRGITAVPSIAVDNSGGPHDGRVYVSYTTHGDKFSQEPADVDVVVQYADTVSGVLGSWSTPVRVHDDATTSKTSQFLPWLAVDSVTGLVAVGWLDTRTDKTGNNEKVRFRAAISTDGGATFWDTSVATADSQVEPGNPLDYFEYLGIDVHNNVVQALWPDNSQNPQTIDLDPFTARIVPYLAADFNEDGDVNGDDFLIWQAGFGTQSGADHSDGDADGDGDVDGDDFLIWQSQFGMSGPLGGGSHHTSSGPSGASRPALWQALASYGLNSHDGDRITAILHGFDDEDWSRLIDDILAIPVY